MIASFSGRASSKVMGTKLKLTSKMSQVLDASECKGRYLRDSYILVLKVLQLMLREDNMWKASADVEEPP